MLFPEIEDGNHLALLGALAHQGHVAARAERQGKSIKQDRFAVPAPPVSAARPEPKSMSSRSIRTMSRIERRASMASLLPISCSVGELCVAHDFRNRAAGYYRFALASVILDLLAAVPRT